MEVCLAVDIGGTKMAVGLVDRAGGLLAERRALTPRSGDAEAVFAALTDILSDLACGDLPRPGKGRPTRRSILACGVGCGGPMQAGGTAVSPLNVPAWRDFPLLDRLSELTGLPVVIDNDAKALALGEGWVGAARGMDDFMAMVVSTGIGGGIVSGGKLLDGSSGNAGHVGHVVVEPGGRRCACGGRGCVEAEASGTAIAAMSGRPAEHASPELVKRSGTMVGRAVASVVNLLDLPLVLIAGSVALGFGRPFFEAASAELSRRARLDFSASARIRPGGLGSSGPLVGAGALAWRLLGEHVLGSADEPAVQGA
ncbi:MAG: ROK family protein [Acidimicrobiales bacterium]